MLINSASIGTTSRNEIFIDPEKKLDFFTMTGVVRLLIDREFHSSHPPKIGSMHVCLPKAPARIHLIEDKKLEHG